MTGSVKFLIDPTDLYNLSSIAAEIYRSERCGICELGGDADTFWSNPVSRWGHPTCVKMITPAESKLIETIRALFEDPRKQNVAHALAVREVRKICEPYTISAYVKENGIEKATILFNTFGVGAAEKYAEKVRKDEHEHMRATKLLITNVGWVGDALSDVASKI